MSVQVQLRRFNSMERRPRMLKDFLSENSNSCSSSGFKSVPRKPNDRPSRMHSLIDMELKSRTKNSSNYSPFQTLINTIRRISLFTAVKKSPSMNFLPRSLSRKLSSSRSRRRNQTFCKGGSSSSSSEIKISTVKIKDIIRWKSFRDLVEEHNHHQPPPSPPPLPRLNFHSCKVGSTTTTTTTTCSSSGSSWGSSWSDSDFTSGYLSSWEAQNDDVEAGKKFSFSPLVAGKDSVQVEQAAGMAVGAKEVLTCQEDEQQSPVSVLQVGEDEFSPFDQSLANFERRKQKSMQTIERFESLAKFDLANLDLCLSLDENSDYDEEYNDDDYDYEEEVEEQDWVEKRARQLLHCVKATGSLQSCEDYYLGTLLLDFFREELTGRRNQTRNDDEFELEILRIAQDWINGSFGYDIEHVNKDTYIKDMDLRARWSGFEEEKEELALEIETAILHNLVADLLDQDG